MPTDIKGVILEPTQQFSNVWAYNHNFYEISTDNIVGADYLDITTVDTELRLYPDADGVFTFDTYEYSRELFGYKDTYTYSGDLIDNNQFKAVTFDLVITLLDETTEAQTLDITFYNGVVQRWESPNVLDYNDGIDKIPYFDGYPFDYSLITSTEVTRTSVIDTNIIDIVNTDCEGVYLKYHNSKGGYSYYLFNEEHLGVYSTSSYGSIKEQFSWTNNTFELGKKGQRKINIFSKIPYKYRELMHMLADSNEVYLYTGNKGDEAFFQPAGIGIDPIGSTPIGFTGSIIGTSLSDKWLEVKIDKMKVNDSNNENAFEQPITILLPEEQTRTRI